MPLPDPFAIPEPGFEQYQGPVRNLEFAQADQNSTGLKTWLLSQLEQERKKERPALPKGCYLQQTRSGTWELLWPVGGNFEVYTGERDTLLEIASRPQTTNE